jgi:hypothetical protein
VGKEMTALGLPVVSYCPWLLLYPPALHEIATTLPEYYVAVERALASGWNLERVRKAYRWLAVEYRHALLDISDGFTYQENSFVERVWRRLSRMIHPGLERRLEDLQRGLDCRRRPERLAQADAIAQLVSSGAATPLDLKRPRAEASFPGDETRALARELRRIRLALFGAGPCASAQSLCAHLDAAATADR